MKDETKIKDWRSTGRRIGRRVLFKSYIEYRCDNCHRTVIEPPKDAPSWFEEIWPEDNRELTSQLQVQHISKDPSNNSLEEIKWLCPSCHKLEDSTTDVGVAVETIKFF